MVPRGGIEFPHIPLKHQRFSHRDFPVYPSVYPEPTLYQTRRENSACQPSGGDGDGDDFAKQGLVGPRKARAAAGHCEHGRRKARPRRDVRVGIALGR